MSLLARTEDHSGFVEVKDLTDFKQTHGYAMSLTLGHQFTVPTFTSLHLNFKVQTSLNLVVFKNSSNQQILYRAD